MVFLRIRWIFIGLLLLYAVAPAFGQSAATRTTGTSGITENSGAASSSHLTQGNTTSSVAMENEEQSVKSLNEESRRVNATSDMTRPGKRRYMKVVELVRVSWPAGRVEPDSRYAGRVVVGLNKPYYRIKEDLRVIGNLDFKIDIVMMGISTTTKITVKYDLKQNIADRSTKIKLLADQFAFKIYIPFGRN